MADFQGQNEELLALTTEIVAAYAGRNQIAQTDLPGLIQSVHATLTGLSGGAGADAVEVAPVAEAAPVPAVPIDSSVQKDAIICLECGKGFKTLKRHLSTEHGMTPAEYKERWQLSKDYPLVAPSYSKRRADTAKKIGLGRKPKS
ncbi:MucR family transcriptional regulator [Psychromarinibacter sediminicola]|nr:MucR family transcriptional regulator [Psychromarinibacter sediminicola]